MIPSDFDTDPYPGKPKILFIAQGVSSHTIDWINLFEDSDLNVRLFSLPHGAPPADWPVRTYVTGVSFSSDVADSGTRKRRYPLHPHFPSLSTRVIKRFKRQIGIPENIPDLSPEKWLIEIIESWQPDLIQALSMTAATYFYDACMKYSCRPESPWMVMIWGAPDIVTQQYHPEKSRQISQVLQQADYVFSDTEECMDATRRLGLKPEQIPEFYLFPGAGGIDVDAAVALWAESPPSKRRMLLWPKSYHTYYMSGLSTLEAIRLAWDEIQPCELVIPNLKADVEHWLWTLPQPMRDHIRTPAHMPHTEFQSLMAQARVMLSPSLLDGVPNVLVDAMACGAFPIMSPLGGIKPLLTDQETALFAHNLYPDDVAQAIVRAMNDDELVDSAAQKNLSRVRQFADRSEIRRQVLHIYRAAIQAGRTTT